MELYHFSIEIFIVLFLISIIAGFIDVLAGGGGLLVIPSLILSGIPPHAVLATNKLQSCAGTGTATYLMYKMKKIQFLELRKPLIFAFIGTTVGTIIIQFMDAGALDFIIPIVLLFIGINFLRPSKVQPLGKRSSKTYQNVAVPVIACYDGMFGPGTGSFFALAGTTCMGYSLIDATARAKALNFVTNIGSLFIFILSGHIVWAIGLVMILGQLIGARIGSHYLFKIDSNWLRKLIVLLCFSMLIKYCFSIDFNVP